MRGRGGGRYTVFRRVSICNGRLRGHERSFTRVSPRKARG